MPGKPKISIISPSRNTGKYLVETIESIRAQTCQEWEHIVVDGGSTDDTIEILKRYPHIRWISEPDRGPDDAILKGLAMAEGDYVTLCCVSDGYIDKNWLNKCIDILDNNPEISLVWGIDQNMLEDGTLDKIVCNDWFKNPPPSGKEYIYYWLNHRNLFHERDLCVRKNVMKECYPSLAELSELGDGYGYMGFAISFTASGYLPYFIKGLAAYGRYQRDAISKTLAAEGKMDKFFFNYDRKILKLKKDILSGKSDFHYRDGQGNVLPGKLDRFKVLAGLQPLEIKELLLGLLPAGILLKLKNIKRTLFGPRNKEG